MSGDILLGRVHVSSKTAMSHSNMPMPKGKGLNIEMGNDCNKSRKHDTRRRHDFAFHVTGGIWRGTGRGLTEYGSGDQQVEGQPASSVVVHEHLLSSRIDNFTRTSCPVLTGSGSCVANGVHGSSTTTFGDLEHGTLTFLRSLGWSLFDNNIGAFTYRTCKNAER